MIKRARSFVSLLRRGDSILRSSKLPVNKCQCLLCSKRVNLTISTETCFSQCFKSTFTHYLSFSFSDFLAKALCHVFEQAPWCPQFYRPIKVVFPPKIHSVGLQAIIMWLIDDEPYLDPQALARESGVSGTLVRVSEGLISICPRLGSIIFARNARTSNLESKRMPNL